MTHLSKEGTQGQSSTAQQLAHTTVLMEREAALATMCYKGKGWKGSAHCEGETSF